MDHVHIYELNGRHFTTQHSKLLYSMVILYVEGKQENHIFIMAALIKDFVCVDVNYCSVITVAGVHGSR